jgi:hypothetical protein
MGPANRTGITPIRHNAKSFTCAGGAIHGRGYAGADRCYQGPISQRAERADLVKTDVVHRVGLRD